MFPSQRGGGRLLSRKMRSDGGVEQQKGVMLYLLFRGGLMLYDTIIRTHDGSKKHVPPLVLHVMFGYYLLCSPSEICNYSGRKYKDH